MDVGLRSNAEAALLSAELAGFLFIVLVSVLPLLYFVAASFSSSIRNMYS